ncbi:MAG: hypothetical protein JW789_03485 [Candidatus Aenigmarchaeota archaeon]|nr:hypothetical protein [Candidatus Aenigmarchaeota archaeon]
MRSELALKIKNHRLWLPKEIQKNIGKEFIEITIRKDGTNEKFLTKLTNDGRFFIPKEIRKKMDLKHDDNVDVSVEMIRNLQRSVSHLKGKKFDMLSFIPKKTMSDFDIHVNADNGRLKLWYSTKGRPNEIIIRRFVPLEFARLLGYYQAEGGKLRLKKRRGRELSFTNKSKTLVSDFIKLSEYILDENVWKCSIRHEKNIEREKLNEAKRFAVSLGIEKENISVSPAERISSFTFRLWITNSLLAEIVSNMADISRKKLYKNSEINRYFLQGLLAGDGSFFSHRDKNGSLHSRMYVYEAKKNYAEDYNKLLSEFDLDCNIKKDRMKNFYIMTRSVNWENLVTLYDKRLFILSKKHHENIINTIKGHKRYRALKHFKNLPDEFENSLCRKITGKDETYVAGWLRDRAKDGMIERAGFRKWVILNSGIEVRKFLNKLQSG